MGKGGCYDTPWDFIIFLLDFSVFGIKWKLSTYSPSAEKKLWKKLIFDQVMAFLVLRWRHDLRFPRSGP